MQPLLYYKWRMMSTCVVPGLHSHAILSPLGCLSMMKAAVSHDDQISCIVWGAVCFPQHRCMFWQYVWPTQGAHDCRALL